MGQRAGQRGFSLIELLIFIVVVGVGITGVLSVLILTTSRSADPMPRKQALSIAEALVEEVQLMPYTWCDPDDANAANATSSGDCTTAEALGPEAGETRGSATLPFDNVNDYNGFTMIGITDITGAAIAPLSTYTASVAVAQAAIGSVPSSDALLVTVTVSKPGTDTIVLTAYRTRYAPQALP